ncbi:hypothetical protein [Jeotgalibaca caeni]|uniref:hypothetical protein n=1 Tax=Jeotgalibaca caeni TaxID=3028623 RepID=UPI00237E2A25|nr:hypothetical protein [Jeotgalibaca caeni]MDE1547618.1 hypothetical protein [Jeotgalibaca caeni]
MNLAKDIENALQSVFLIMIVMLKQYAGSSLGEYENVIFVFSAVTGSYLIHFLFVKLSKNYPKRDDWEEKLNLLTLLAYGFGLLVLQLLGVKSIFVLGAVGIILIAMNILIKTKRKSIKKKMEE